MRKNIVITGASGLVATELTHLLLADNNRFHVHAVSTHPEKLRERYKEERNINCLTLRELGSLKDCKICAIIHCAFARSKDPGELAKSLQFTSELLTIVKTLRPSLL